ncbi:MAG TPA: molybdopterin molybdenumtransferase MoeA, partial [Desulfobulbus sp.]|nr:molybdopterin molybdenumtransferase MoeA [Desulfobulbus sp.]
MENTKHHTTRSAPVSLEQARSMVCRLGPLPVERLALDRALGRVVASDIVAVSDCPSVDSSLKDGYAVVSSDLRQAAPEAPVRLGILGTLTAGQGSFAGRVRSGSAVRIMTGAAIPAGADAVLASEFAREEDGAVLARADAHPGRNILRKGADVRAGDVVVRSGTLLRAAHLGLLAAAGAHTVPVHRLPRVAVVATGSELVAPGEPVGPGRVAASNMVTLAAGLRREGLAVSTVILRDNLEELYKSLAPLIGKHDLVLTCGGVLDGDRDYTMRAMAMLGVEPLFTRVRVGPGKGTCMGRKGTTVVFNLPGGPPSNHVGFLLLALPAVRRLAGYVDPFGSRLHARLTRPVRGGPGWTQVVYGRLVTGGTALEV